MARAMRPLIALLLAARISYAAAVTGGACAALRLSASGASCVSGAWCAYMPAITELAALDAAGSNAALSSNGAVASADSAMNDNGNCGCLAASAARTSLFASYAIGELVPPRVSTRARKLTPVSPLLSFQNRRQRRDVMAGRGRQRRLLRAVHVLVGAVA